MNGDRSSSLLHRWDTEVFILQGGSRQELLRTGEHLLQFLSSGPWPQPKDLAFTLNCPLQESGYRLAIVADSLDDFRKKLAYGLKRLSDPERTRIKDRSGIFYFEEPLSREGSLVFLFPGEGSQYVNMLSDLCVHFPDVRACFDRADRIFLNAGRDLLLSQVLFPPPLQSSAGLSDEILWQMNFAVAAVLEADQALFGLLDSLEIRPQAVVGHSSGEYAALLASGVLEIRDEEQLLRHAFELNTLYGPLEDQIPAATLMTVGAADPAVVSSVLEESGGALYVTMDNCPHQVILCGIDAAVARARDRLQNQGAICNLLPFKRAYHTPLFQPVCEQLSHFFQRLRIVAPHTPIYSCVTAALYPHDPVQIRQLAVEQWARAVRFRETIEAMYDDGARIFVEVGPKGNLTGFVDDILRKRRYLAVPSNLPHRSGITQLNTLIGLLAAHGVSMRLDRLYERRAAKRLSLEGADEAAVNHREGTGSMRLALELPRLSLTKEGWDDTRDVPISPLSPLSTPTVVSDPLRSSTEYREKNLLHRLGDVARPSYSEDGMNLTQVSTLAATSPLARTWLETDLPHQDNLRSRVMGEYLQTMGRFLDLQREVTMSFMAGTKVLTKGVMSAGQGEAEAPSLDEDFPWPESHAPQGPFHIIVSACRPGEEVIATCQLDLDEHLFLRHHTIGGRPSALDDRLTALPIVPLSISLEIMAQVASLLVPKSQLIALRNVRAHQWILMEGECRTLLVSARCKSPEAAGEVEVRIFENNGAESPRSEDRLILEGVLLFGDEYPEPPSAGEIPLRSQRPYQFAPEQYYREVMFHGPTFQSVVAIDRCGENGLDATVRVPPGIRLFRSNTNPRLHSDPVLLDAAGQLVGFWTVDRLQTRSVVFPIGFESLSIYGPWPGESEPVRCQARPTALTDGWVRSNIDMAAPGGRLLVRLLAWEDMRIDLPRQFCRFVLSPRDVVLSSSWTPAISALPAGSRPQCCRLDGLPAAIFEEGALPRAWIRMILSRREQEVWLSLNVPEKRRKEWLVGRMAAKDTVRLFLKERYHIELCPADIEIETDEHGRPIIVTEPIDKLGCRLSLSIAHSGESAVAVVAESSDRGGVGVDIEWMGQSHEGLDKGALAEEEQTLLAAMPSAIREEWLLRLWCAKESAAKALGFGMVGGPLNLVVQEVEMESGKVGVKIVGELARQLPEYDGMLLTAYSGRENELIFASSLIESITRS